MEIKMRIPKVNFMIFIICIDWSRVEFLYHWIEYGVGFWSELMELVGADFWSELMELDL